MAKTPLTIGFATTQETSPDVFTELIEEKIYVGDLFRQKQSNMSGDSVNPNLKLSNTISILADDYMRSNSKNIRYVVLWNNKWSVSNIEIQEKRLLLYIGEVYNA